MKPFEYKGDAADWSQAYIAEPHYYTRPDGTVFGAFALNEMTLTVFPKEPQNRYLVESKPVREWRMLLFSRSEQRVLGDTDFFAALEKLRPLVQDENPAQVLIGEADLETLRSLL